MEALRLILIFFHTLIMIFAAINLHPHLSLASNGKDRHKQMIAVIHYITNLCVILLYHVSSIIAVWYSRRFGVGMVQASGVLLIGEMLQVMTTVIQQALDTHRLENEELVLSVLYHLILLLAAVLTFRLAEKISSHQKDPMQIELFRDMNINMDASPEPTFI
ncbi:unnamed protein product [Adineta steineri]|uniref:Uncharacterized protein n=1 Tax=Adineta steineri TaxID=433720 RepID=A0A816DJ00_9BILA|nr:unnamed protein product [Adineta steineri]CAF1475235.1 unnamed protein product [Adineta steineri]CAF1637068.1 unnamed protein product [Adineta steineri]CAF3800814.1 unnamed protein product [Adineta steineri]